MTREFEHLIRREDISDVLIDNYMPYAAYVIGSRALPEIDGFKPVHRKLLYSMYNTGLLKGGKIKSSTIVGEAMKFHPHGDTAIYETMVRLTDSNEALRYPYVEGKGSFGKHYLSGTTPAAMRYTEAKLHPNCELVFRDINKKMVEFVPNHDNTLKEPELLPVIYPNILTTNNEGMAVAMASTICSFNVVEVCELMKEYLKNKKVDPLDYITGPDLPYGGVFIDDGESLKKVIETGRGPLRIRGKYDIDKKNREIVFTELPYTATIEQIMDQIADNAKGNVNNKDNKMPGIRTMRDDTDRKGLKLTIVYKQGYDPEEIVEQLFHYTKLEDQIDCNFNILRRNGYPQVMGVKEIIADWYEWRLEAIERGLISELEKLEHELHLIDGFEKIIEHIDEIIAIIKKEKQDEKIISVIMKKFKLSRIQTEYILEIKLRNLSQEYLNKRIEKYNNIKDNYDWTKRAIKSKSMKNTLIKKDMDYTIDRIGDKKKTGIIKEKDIQRYTEEKKEENFNVLAIITNEEYIKKIPEKNYESNEKNILRSGDSIKESYSVDNESELITLTNKGNAYKKVLADIPNHSMKDIGEYIYNIHEFEKGERAIYHFVSKDFDENLFIIFKDGNGARIDLEAYKTKTRRSVLRNSLNTESEPVFIGLVSKDGENILINKSDGKSMLFNSNLVTERKSRNTKGLRVVRLNKKDEITHVDIIKNPNKLEIVRVDRIPSAGIDRIEELNKEEMREFTELFEENDDKFVSRKYNLVDLKELYGRVYGVAPESSLRKADLINEIRKELAPKTIK